MGGDGGSKLQREHSCIFFSAFNSNHVGCDFLFKFLFVMVYGLGESDSSTNLESDSLSNLVRHACCHAPTRAVGGGVRYGF